MGSVSHLGSLINSQAVYCIFSSSMTVGEERVQKEGEREKGKGEVKESGKG